MFDYGILTQINAKYLMNIKTERDKKFYIINHT